MTRRARLSSLAGPPGGFNLKAADHHSSESPRLPVMGHSPGPSIPTRTGRSHGLRPGPGLGDPQPVRPTAGPHAGHCTGMPRQPKSRNTLDMTMWLFSLMATVPPPSPEGSPGFVNRLPTTFPSGRAEVLLSVKNLGIPVAVAKKKILVGPEEV